MPMRRQLMRLESGWLLLIAAVASVLVLWLQVSRHCSVTV